MNVIIYSAKIFHFQIPVEWNLLFQGVGHLCYSSTNFLGQLRWHHKPLRWNNNPPELGGYLRWFKYTTRIYMGFPSPLSVYIPLCYFRHDYFELGLTLVVLLRNSMDVDGCEWVGRTFLGHLDDWQVGGASTHAANILFYRFCTFYHCLRYLIIDGFSYVMQFGWVFSRFLPTSKHASAGFSGLGSSDTHL